MGKLQVHFLKTWTWTKSWEWSTPHRASTPPLRRRRRRSLTTRWSERWRSPSTSSSSSRPTSPWSTGHRVAPTVKVSPRKRLSTKTFCRRSSARILWIWWVKDFLSKCKQTFWNTAIPFHEKVIFVLLLMWQLFLLSPDTEKDFLLDSSSSYYYYYYFSFWEPETPSDTFPASKSFSATQNKLKPSKQAQ